MFWSQNVHLDYLFFKLKKSNCPIFIFNILSCLSSSSVFIWIHLNIKNKLGNIQWLQQNKLAGVASNHFLMANSFSCCWKRFSKWTTNYCRLRALAANSLFAKSLSTFCLSYCKLELHIITLFKMRQNFPT